VPTQAFGSEFVYGVQPVLAVLKAKKRSVYNLFINQESSGGKDRCEAKTAPKENDKLFAFLGTFSIYNRIAT
jgi:tRNA G18 (ribose-2'-O)-methylase SpoU